MANLHGLTLTLRCPSGELLSRTEANDLCRKVTQLFENQGAVVQTEDAGSVFRDAEIEESGPTDLTVELGSRQVHADDHLLSWALCVVSFTLLPGVSEQSFAQDVEIRDQDGFLLVRDSMQGRLVRRFGLGSLIGNWVLDWTLRKPEERQTGDSGELDMSADIYGQLTQWVYNAKVQQEILRASVPPEAP